MTGAPVLVTGGAGFIGCNVADRLAADGHEVIVFDTLARPGVERNLAWLRSRHPRLVTHIQADIRDTARLDAAVDAAHAVLHFAAQVAVTTSLESPLDDFAINLEATLRLLEAVRRRRVPLIFASTNKVYGALADVELRPENEAWMPADPTLRARGISETRPLDFHTPYGCSKGAADQYVLDYARSFGIPAAVIRMSCVYGPRQMGTEDQGWVAHFLLSALAGREITIFGDGRQVRDILHVDDAVDAYLRLLARIETQSGRAFNLGGGTRNAVGLLQLIRHIESLLGRKVAVRHEAARAGDQRYFVADIGRARRDLGIANPIDWRDGVARLAEWLHAGGAASGPIREQVDA